MPSKYPQVHVALPAEDDVWVRAESQRLRVSMAEVVRRAVRHYWTHAEPAPEPAETPDQLEETPMPRPRKSSWNSMPTASKKKYTAENPLDPSDRVVPPSTTCSRCGTETWATLDGLPRVHLRATKPGDPGYRPDLPTRTDCY